MTEDFLRSLFETGSAVVPRTAEFTDTPEVRSVLLEQDAMVRADFPGTAPSFDAESAFAAAHFLLLLTQCVVYRERDEIQLQQALQQINLLPTDNASQHYSADLTLRYLPDIAERLQRTSADDPVLEVVRSIGRQWPLSSVGMPESQPESLPDCLTVPPLLHCYIDRILIRRASERLTTEHLRRSAAAAAGPESDFCALFPPNVGRAHTPFRASARS